MKAKSILTDLEFNGNNIAGTKSVTASEFIGKLTGNADTATKAEQDGDGNVIPNTYLSKKDAQETYATKAYISDHEASNNEQLAALRKELHEGESSVAAANVTAKQAAESAAAAQSAASSAKADALAAQSKAETAQTAAEAAQAQSEAAQSAAETAKAEALTAKAASEEAQTGAESAKADALAAQSKAETAAENAQSSAENAAAQASAAVAGVQTQLTAESTTRADADEEMGKVSGAALALLAARLDALEASRDKLGAATAGSIDANEVTRYRYPLVLLGHGVPSKAVTPTNLPDGLPWDGVPIYAGQLYINLDATSGGLYYAVGTGAVSDWKNA